MASSSSIISSGSTFTVCMQKDAVHVTSVPSEDVPKCAWWLVREYGMGWNLKSFFNAVLLDDDGLTIVSTAASLTALRSLNLESLQISPQKWISLTISVTGSASELPGVVFYLANALSKSGFSILHMSTFDSEVFLVQEQDVDLACDLLRQLSDMNINQYANIISEENKGQMNGSLYDNTIFRRPMRENQSSDDMHDVPLSGFVLSKLPRHLVLAKLNSEFPLEQCADVVMRLLLYDPRYSSVEKVQRKASERSLDYIGNRSLSRVSSGVSSGVSAISIKNIKSQSEFSSSGSGSGTSSLDQSPRASRTPSLAAANGHSNGATRLIGRNSVTDSLGQEHSRAIKLGSFMMGFWQREDELTFLIDEEDLDMFPEGALDVSPQRWRVIKLCGRAIEFDETGIVSAMSRIESTVACLNISTATTNCTLVPEELFDTTATALSEALQCPIEEVRVDPSYQAY